MDNRTTHSLAYWHNQLEKINYLWEDLFKKNPITKESVFGHFVITNCYGPEHEDTWIAFPNIDALLGFIELVFLPAAFVERMEGEKSEGFVPVMYTLQEWIEIFEKNDENYNQLFIEDMKLDLQVLQNIRGIHEKEKVIIEVKRFAQHIGEKWAGSVDLFFYFQVFESPMDIANYIINAYQEDQMEDHIEEQLEVTLEEWKHISANVYENEFMKRKLMDILNNKIQDMM